MYNCHFFVFFKLSGMEIKGCLPTLNFLFHSYCFVEGCLSHYTDTLVRKNTSASQNYSYTRQ